VLAVLVVVWVMLALSAVGIDIGPLLAGAGVVGLALGFGAQTLVRDVVSGIFFLLDDAFRVGEYIEAGPLKGTVEAISVRSLRLRHHRGAVHTVPYGELKSLTNQSRDWVIVKLEILVTYDTGVDRVKAILKQIGNDLLQDTVMGPNFIEPLKSQGISQLADHGIPGAGEVHGQTGRAVREPARGVPPHQARVRRGRHQVRLPDVHDPLERRGLTRG
jgi:small-conductance mechanosensitive channel